MKNSRSASAGAAILNRPTAKRSHRIKLTRLQQRLEQKDQEIEKLRAQLASVEETRDDQKSTVSPTSSAAPRLTEAYRTTVGRIRELVDQSLPANSIVLVVSRGDEDLLNLGNRRGWHFPQNAKGIYLGHHPADSAMAIQHLEELRARGGQFLLFPATALWWLQHYKGLHEHLEKRYRTITSDNETCKIFDLRDGNVATAPAANTLKPLRSVGRPGGVRWFVDCLLPEDATVAVISGESAAAVDLGSRKTWRLPEESMVRDDTDFAHSITEVRVGLERVRAIGAQYLVILHKVGPQSDKHPDLNAFLRNHCHTVIEQPNVCSIFEF